MKKSFFLNYVEIQHEQYKKVILEKLVIEKFILCNWNDWMNIVTKVGKFKVKCLHRSSILKIILIRLKMFMETTKSKIRVRILSTLVGTMQSEKLKKS